MMDTKSLNKVNKLCLIFIFILICVSLLIIGVNYINKNYMSCTITKNLNRECYERHGKIYRIQYVEVNDNTKGVINCGQVINCKTSPCNVRYNIGASFYYKFY